MARSAGDIQTGMEVYGSDGGKIGNISEIYPDVPVDIFGTVPQGSATVVVDEARGTATTTPDYSAGTTTGYDEVIAPVAPPQPMGTGATGTTGCFKVEQSGILGIGSKELYIPLGGVTNVVPGERVSLNCTKDECSEHYATRPPALDQDTETNQLT